MTTASIAQERFGEFLASLAAKVPTPGGGAAAGATGALAAATAQMVVSFSLGKKNLAEHQPALEHAAATLTRARALFLELADEDARAYGLYNELSRLPESDPRRLRELPAVAAACVSVPLAALAAAADLAALCRDLAPITNRHLRSDLAIAAILADAAARASERNVNVNLPNIAAAAERARLERLSAEVLSRAIQQAALAAEAAR